MPKKNGFIAISVIYSFFLCFVMLMMGLLANYANAKLLLRKTNEPLIYNQDNTLYAKITKNTIHNAPDTEDGLYNTTEDYYSLEEDHTNHVFNTTYYFKGNVVNNYVKFAGKDWRIVRINGDRTIRLILKDRISTAAFNNTSNGLQSVGYTYGNNNTCTKSSPCESTYNGSSNFTNSKNGTNSTIKNNLENWYQTNLAAYDAQIDYSLYYNDNFDTKSIIEDLNQINFNTYQNINNNSTILNYFINSQADKYGGLYKLKIGLLTAEEANLARNDRGSYLNIGREFWTMTPAYYTVTQEDGDDFTFQEAYMLYVNSSGNLDTKKLTSSSGIRPVINLKSNVKVKSGNGTSAYPYIINEEEDI